MTVSKTIQEPKKKEDVQKLIFYVMKHGLMHLPCHISFYGNTLLQCLSSVHTINALLYF